MSTETKTLCEVAFEASRTMRRDFDLSDCCFDKLGVKEKEKYFLETAAVAAHAIANDPTRKRLLDALKMSQCWLKAALECKDWKWDSDQYKAAEQSYVEGEAALSEYHPTEYALTQVVELLTRSFPPSNESVEEKTVAEAIDILGDVALGGWNNRRDILAKRIDTFLKSLSTGEGKKAVSQVPISLESFTDLCEGVQSAVYNLAPDAAEDANSELVEMLLAMNKWRNKSVPSLADIKNLEERAIRDGDILSVPKLMGQVVSSGGENPLPSPALTADNISQWREDKILPTPSTKPCTNPLPLGRRDIIDWTEDYEQENGNYENKCCHCGWTFYGHKRRVICKGCANPISKGGEA